MARATLTSRATPAHEDNSCAPGAKWRTSAHAHAGVSCTECHKSHYNVPPGTKATELGAADAGEDPGRRRPGTGQGRCGLGGDSCGVPGARGAGVANLLSLPRPDRRTGAHCPPAPDRRPQPVRMQNVPRSAREHPARIAHRPVLAVSQGASDDGVEILLSCPARRRLRRLPQPASEHRATHPSQGERRQALSYRWTTPTPCCGVTAGCFPWPNKSNAMVAQIRSSGMSGGSVPKGSSSSFPTVSIMSTR